MFVTIRRLLDRRGMTSGEEGIALLLSLFVMLMVSTLSIGLLAVVLNETRPTQFQRKLTRTIAGAEGGLQVVLNQLRAANDGAGKGLISKLPCSTDGATFTFTDGSTVNVDGATFGGSVGTAGSATTYTAYVSYYASDPSSWYATQSQWPNYATTGANSNAQALACPLNSVPAYAFVQAIGRDSAVSGFNSTVGNRSVHATYQFNTTNVNIQGGRMLEFGTTLCLDAGTVPQVGTTLTMQNCNAFGYAPQMWSYRTDLSILYAGNPALNLCIQQPASGNVPTLQTCTSSVNTTNSSTYPYTGTQQKQEWGFNDNGHFAAPASDGSVPNSSPGLCLQPNGANDTTSATVGAQLIYTTCDSGTTGYTAWNPDPQVGAGKAGGATNGLPGATKQLVNYQEFGRCLDITGQDVNADHLIDYPCKQAPDSSKLTFNQVWTFSGSGAGQSGTLSVTKTDGSKYCLTAPTSGTYAVTKVCNGSASQNWTPSGAIAGNYAASYEIVSAGGLCLTADGTNQITYLSSTITVVACDGTAKQKWNAPPNASTQNLANLNEDSGVK